jgi:hypothetical protein
MQSAALEKAVPVRERPAPITWRGVLDSGTDGWLAIVVGERVRLQEGFEIDVKVRGEGGGTQT